MRRGNAGAAGLVVAGLLLALPFGAAAAGALDALSVFSGTFRGKGRVTFSDGRPAEAVVCRTTGRIAGAVFRISGRCGGGNRSGTFSIQVRASGNGYLGTWTSSTTKGAVAFSGSGRDGTFSFRPSGAASDTARLDSLVIRSLSDKRYTLSARGQDLAKKVSGSLQVTFRKR